MPFTLLTMEFVSYFNYITLGPNSIRWYEPSELNYDVNRLIYRAVLLNCIWSKTIITQPNKKYSKLKTYVSLGMALLTFALICFSLHHSPMLAFTWLYFILLCFSLAWIWKYMIRYTRHTMINGKSHTVYVLSW